MKRVHVIKNEGCPVYIGNNVFRILENFLSLVKFKKSKFAILTDTNTQKYCLDILKTRIPEFSNVPIISIPAGEEFKNIESCMKIWDFLIEGNYDRHSILINLGGGVVSDIGGFAASSFKRGIRYINFPTSLIGQIDASLGGKVGIDHHHLKNIIGMFANPQAIFIFPGFLETLPKEHMISGYAEIIKHGLIHNAQYWHEVKVKNPLEIEDWFDIIVQSVEIKNAIVQSDPYERKYRKVLNFGHTIGHALETWSLQHDAEVLSHGQAIAAGMICETYLSAKKFGLKDEAVKEIIDCIVEIYGIYKIDKIKIKDLISLLENDKKSEDGKIMFTLLRSYGHAAVNQECTTELIGESLKFYQKLKP